MAAPTAINAKHSHGLGQAATSGFFWLFAQSVSARLLGFLSQLILAWLLTPSDFGTIGLAYTITGIAQTLVSFGVDEVLLQRQKRLAQWSSAAFWISLCLGTIGMVAVWLAAPVAAHIYKSHSLTWIIIILSVAVPIRTLSIVPSVSIRLAMNFRFLATYNTFEIFAIQFGTIVFAWMGMGAYSFALPIPIVAVIKAAVFWSKSPPVYNRRIKAVQVWYVLGRSTTVFAKRAIVEIVNQGDYIVLGLIATKDTVGLYFFAFRFSVQPIRMLAGNLTNVLLPALAQLGSHPARQIDAVVRACRLLSYLVMPFCFLQAALAGPGLHLLFGQRWQGSIPLVQLLSIGLPFDAVFWIAGSLLSARREFGRSFRIALVSAPIFFTLVIGGAWLHGTLGVATAVVIYYMSYPPLCSILILKSGGVKIDTIVEFYLMPVLFAGGSIGAAYAVSLLPALNDHNLIRVTVISALGGSLYIGALYVFRRDMLMQLADRFQGPLNKMLTVMRRPPAPETGQIVVRPVPKQPAGRGTIAPTTKQG